MDELQPLSKQEALRFIVGKNREAHKMLLNTLIEEMNSQDVEIVLSENGFVPE